MVLFSSFCSDLDSDEDDDDLDSYLGNRHGAGQRLSSYSSPRSDRVRGGTTENGEREWLTGKSTSRAGTAVTSEQEWFAGMSVAAVCTTERDEQYEYCQSGQYRKR